MSRFLSARFGFCTGETESQGVEGGSKGRDFVQRARCGPEGTTVSLTVPGRKARGTCAPGGGPGQGCRPVRSSVSEGGRRAEALAAWPQACAQTAPPSTLPHPHAHPASLGPCFCTNGEPQGSAALFRCLFENFSKNLSLWTPFPRSAAPP